MEYFENEVKEKLGWKISQGSFLNPSGHNSSAARTRSRMGNSQHKSGQLHVCVLSSTIYELADAYNASIDVYVKLCHQFGKIRAGELFYNNRSAQY